MARWRLGSTAAVIVTLAAAVSAQADQVVLSGVPAYDWYHGCGPTAAASIIGYWDLNGCSNLFDAEGWSQVRLTDNVKDQISSPEHNAAYDPDPDVGSIPEEDWNSIADWFRTSVNVAYGWSFLSYADDAFVGYADHRGYEFVSSSESWESFSWADLTSQIDAGNPMMFLVDTDGNSSTDHFIPVFGYEDRGMDGLWYACYTTWSESETVQWKEFLPMGNDWGVGFGIYVHPVPEPATVCPLAVGGLAVIRMRQRARQPKKKRRCKTVGRGC